MIPNNIRKVAEKVFWEELYECQHSGIKEQCCSDCGIRSIEQALLAERKRCAEIAREFYPKSESDWNGSYCQKIAFEIAKAILAGESEAGK